MMDILNLFLPIILLLGLITSYEDIKFGKIRNCWLIFALIYSVILHVTLFYVGKINIDYLLLTLTSFFSGVIIVFFIWYVGLWSPGDGKLVIVFSNLIPFGFYVNSITPLPFIEILLNSLIPLFLILVTISIIKTNNKQKIKAIKPLLSIKNIGRYLLIVFSLSWIINVGFGYFNIQPLVFFKTLLIFLLYRILNKLLKIPLVPFLLFISILRVLIDWKQIYSFSFIYHFISISLLFMVIFIFSSNLSEIFHKKVSFSLLNDGDVPYEGLTNKGKYISFDNFQQMGVKDQNDLLIKPYTPLEKFKKNKIKKIKKLYFDGLIKSKDIKIFDTLPFSPFIFLGVILTILCEGNLILFITSFFN